MDTSNNQPQRKTRKVPKTKKEYNDKYYNSEKGKVNQTKKTICPLCDREVRIYYMKTHQASKICNKNRITPEP